MRFLVTNDDGIDAEGLGVLAEALAQFGAVTVVAPLDHQSGCSHQVNTGRPLRLDERGENRYALDSTPADCVRVGLLHLDPEADWVISGINHGGNLGVDVFMSGTVAAVREATWLGKPGIAFSQYCKRRGQFDWSRAGEWVARVVPLLIEESLPSGAFWNVNLPDLTDEDREPEIVRCGLEMGHLQVVYEHEEGALHYRGVYQNRARTEGSDVDICFSGNIAVTQMLPQA